MKLSAVEAAELCIGNIEDLNDSVNAIVTWDKEQVLLAAAAVDEATLDGRWLGLLHGMTVSLKDNIATAGMRTTSGAKFLSDYIPKEDAEVVRRLRGAGAIIIGKANMQELAFGVVTTNPIFGQCKNPWNLKHIPGGTSGGSGASVAAGMCVCLFACSCVYMFPCPCLLGSDTSAFAIRLCTLRKQAHSLPPEPLPRPHTLFDNHVNRWQPRAGGGVWP